MLYLTLLVPFCTQGSTVRVNCVTACIIMADLADLLADKLSIVSHVTPLILDVMVTWSTVAFHISPASMVHSVLLYAQNWQCRCASSGATARQN